MTKLTLDIDLKDPAYVETVQNALRRGLDTVAQMTHGWRWIQHREIPEPEPEPEIPSHQVTLEEEMDEHLAEAVRISDGVTEGFSTSGVFARKIRTYEGHPYLVIIHDLDDFAAGA